jgi:hypothetical protein
MASCAKIASGIVFNCPPPAPGVDAGQLVLFNYDDIDQDASTLVETNLQVLTRLGSPAPVGYIYEGINNSIRPSYESVVDGFNPYKWNHTVEYRIFADGETVSDIEADLSGGLFVAVYFTKSKYVKVAGWNVGLKATVSRSYYEEEGAALITLATPSEEFEPLPVLTYVGAASPIASFETLKAQIIAMT